MENLQTVDKLYHFYREDCIRLARSIILKSDVNARLMNNEVLSMGRMLTVDEDDRSTWRYYKHLAGEYHEYDHQLLTMRYHKNEENPHPYIRVRSLDSQEIIDFTKENMDIHRATWRAYQIGSDYYNQLIVDYPELETLIKGILFPVNKTKAIEAEEHDIIYYDPLLIDSNEYWLVSELNKDIKRYLSRWDVDFYRITDEYYDVIRWGILYAYIPQMIMNIRLKYANTIFAHSFHIWSYLASHGRLDEYRPYLTLEQSLWLYRNIKWILANVGKTDTFEELIEYIMTKQQLPVSKFITHHNISNVLDEAPNSDRFDDYGIEFHRDQLNLKNLDYDTSDDIQTLRTLMDKEVPRAKFNEDVVDVAHDVGLEKFKWAPHTEQQTKVLESHVTDYSQEEVFPIIQTMFDYLIWSSNYNRYRVQITANNPRSMELMTMSQEEAIVTLYYCLSKLYNKEGIEPDYIPSIYARDIYYPVLTNDIVDKIMEKIDKRAEIDLYVRYIKDIYPSFGLVRSTEEFYRVVKDIHEFKYKLRDLVGFVEDVHMQGELRMFVDSLKVDYWVPLFEKGVSYHQFFRDRGWQITKLKTEDYIILGTQILMKITGMEFHQTTSVASIQNAMVRLTERLSSYTIHFIKSINTQSVIVMDPQTPRIGFVEKAGRSKWWFNHAYPMINNIRQRENKMVDWDPSIIDPDATRFTKSFGVQNFTPELTLEVTSQEKVRRHHTLQTPLVSNVRITGNDVMVERPRYWMFNGSLFTDKIHSEVGKLAADGERVVVRRIETTNVERVIRPRVIEIQNDINELLTAQTSVTPWRSNQNHVITRKTYEQKDDEYTIRDWGRRAVRPDTLEDVVRPDPEVTVTPEETLNVTEVERQQGKYGTLTTDLDRIYKTNITEDTENGDEESGASDNVSP